MAFKFVVPTSPPPTNNTHLTEYTEKVENVYFPEQLANECPVSSYIYNLFEQNLPTTGHMALLAATSLASMCYDGYDEPGRHFNLAIGSEVGEGKTTILSKFSRVYFLNLFNRTTFSHYILNYCGYYLDSTKPVGKEIPSGVKVERLGRNQKVSKVETIDYIRNRFDLVHAAEGILSIGDVGSLMQLWNGLIEEGYWSGGNRYVGHYKIGDEKAPIKHGLILACTIHDFDNEIVKQIGLLSRIIPVVYHCTREENDHIIEGRKPPTHIKYHDFSFSVAESLKHLNAVSPPKVWFNTSLDDKKIDGMIKVIMQARKEKTGKRAINDVNRILLAHAALNGRKTVNEYDCMVAEALTLMCKKISLMNDTYYFGDRLHFQVKLRSNFLDAVTVKQDMRYTFTKWDDVTPLYSEVLVDKASKSFDKEELTTLV